MRQFSWGDIEELSRLIASHGFCQAILVERNRPNAEQPYRLIAGERRLRAVRDYLKWDQIPAQVVKSGTDRQAARVLQLQENLGRSDLHWLEIAATLEQWQADGVTTAEIARAMGQHEATVRSTMRAYRGLCPESRAMLIKGRHRPPLERALTWVAWANKPEKQREAIEQWLGLQKSPRKKTGKHGKKPEGPIPRFRVERMLERAISRRANQMVLTCLRHLLGETVTDPFRSPRSPQSSPKPPPSRPTDPDPRP